MAITFSKKMVSFDEVEIDLGAVLESLDTQEEKDAASGVEITALAMTDWDELQIDFKMEGVDYIAAFKEPHLAGNTPEITLVRARAARNRKMESFIPYLEAVRAACDI